ncbi:MAG: alpha/beta hydrolase [Clostridia bacterium]|nr:alpha/beta hydrolase [Clostridia bacterium]
MKKTVKTALYALAAAALASGLFCAFSHIVYGRSAAATAVELYLRVATRGRMMTEEETLKLMRERAEAEDGPLELPRLKYASEVEDTELFGCRMMVFSGSDAPERTVIYMHGGAYVNEITRYHLRFCDTLAQRVNARVIAPIYPLAPNHGYAETYEIIDALYDAELSRGLPIIMMGDSAGGGFAAAFCEKLVREGRPLPQSEVLLSPWVDVSMSGSDYAAYRDTDPMVGLERIRTMGKSWARELDTKDPLISPLYGSAEGLPKTLVFLGTRELLYPDIVEFCEKLENAGVPVQLEIKRGMNHVYPVYPIPEAKEAMDIIEEFVLE